MVESFSFQNILWYNFGGMRKDDRASRYYERYEGLAVNVATALFKRWKEYCEPAISLEDIVQQARLYLLEAIEKVDWDRDAPEITNYLKKYIYLNTLYYLVKTYRTGGWIRRLISKFVEDED